MVFITGDCHADYCRFDKMNFPVQVDMTRDDTMIICGDFGIWHNCHDEQLRLNWLERRPYTTVFVDGNHENFDRLYSDEFPVVDFHGGKAHQIRPHIFHLIRGNVFDFEGKKFFAFGGASSHDIEDGILDRDNFKDDVQFENAIFLWRRWGRMFRVNHESWWKEELPSQEEMDFGLRMLKKNDNRVDYIISHCCPYQIAYAMGFKEGDSITRYFTEISQSVEFSRWYFGHYHRNESVHGKYICLYEHIERVL